MNLPTFKYHPDPVANGVIEASDRECQACGQARCFIYTGPVYAEAELDNAICPWCIADGTAHEKFDAEFTDSAGIGGYGDWPDVNPEIIAEVSQRTPGFHGWQQEQWFTHCNDAAQFLGPAGKDELEAFGEAAISAIEEDAAMDDEWEDYLESLDKDGGPTAYIFKCRHCGQLGGYSDCH